jgi:hypothetical protein
MANAIANYLQKKLLMVNFPSLREKSMSELMRLIFREAKLYDAIIFFGTLARPLIVFAWFGLPDSCQARAVVRVRPHAQTSARPCSRAGISPSRTTSRRS